MKLTIWQTSDFTTAST